MDVEGLIHLLERIERDGAVWLVRRSERGMLGGMAALPGGEWTAKEAAAGPVLARIRHVFTHFALELDIIALHERRSDGWWQPLDSIDQAGLPTLYRKAIYEILKTREKLAA